MSAGPVRRDELTAEFFDGTGRGEFLLKHCRACGAFTEPQAVQCHSCGSTDVEWRAAAGDATVVSWVVTHGKPDDAGNTRQHVLVIAQFTEGPWWWSHVDDVDPERMRVGLALRVGFERSGDDEQVPIFLPA